MPYNTIKIALHDDQLAILDAAVNREDNFAVMAQPYIKGPRRGELLVYILTPKQFQTVQPAIIEARELPAYEPKR